MDNNVNTPDAVKLVLDPEKDEVSGVNAKAINLYIPAEFPGIAKETLEFLNRVGLHYASKTDGFSACLVEDGGRELDISCEVFIRADDSVWVHFNEDNEQHALLGSVEEFSEKIALAMAKERQSAAPKMGV